MDAKIYRILSLFILVESEGEISLSDGVAGGCSNKRMDLETIIITKNSVQGFDYPHQILLF